MENQKKGAQENTDEGIPSTPENNLTLNSIKSKLTSFAVGSLALVITFVVAFGALSLIQSSEAHYEAKLEKLSSEKAEVEKQICETTKQLSDLKIDHREELGLSASDISKLAIKAEWDCEKGAITETVSVSEEFLPTAHLDIESLFYVFYKNDSAKITQTTKQHSARNGYIATDIATDGQKLSMYAPGFTNKDGEREQKEYTVHLVNNPGTMGETVELHWQENGSEYAWWIGHFNKRSVEEGQKVKTGDHIGLSGGCPGELKLGEKSTGCHVHVELRIDDQAVHYPLNQNTKHKREEVF